MLGCLAGTTAHDLNNLLTVGCASAELLRMSAKEMPSDQLDLVNEINASFARMMELARQLTHQSRTGVRIDLESGDARALLYDAVSTFVEVSKPDAIEISLVAPEPVAMPLHGALFRSMLTELLANAVEAQSGAGIVEIRLQQEDVLTRLEIHDQGPGIPEKDRTRVFEAFYTTKPGRQGLGLLAVKAITQAHGGRIVALSSPLGGACLRMVFPRQSARSAAR